jgi:hypothetical protein
MPRYAYTVEGTGRGGAPWKVSGEVTTDTFWNAPHSVARESFTRLTEGKAEYGDLGTCHGPYTIKHLDIQLLEN